jgi:endogenous inhibitor of DNA gyrase (YacG/DUF329 family)
VTVALHLAICPSCGAEVPAWRIENGHCPLCDDDCADALQSSIDFNDNVRAAQTEA